MLIGHSCSGKDSVAKELEEITGKPWMNLSFSHDLSNVCKLYETSPSLAMMELEKLSPFIKINEKEFLGFKKFINKKDAHRTSLKVELGTWARMQDKDVWVRWVLQYISNHPFEDMIVTDVRLENEFVALRQRGFIPIAVKADTEIRMKRRLERDGVSELPSGKSEEEIDYLQSQCQISIENNEDDINSLSEQVSFTVSLININEGDKHQLS